jgi:hypothetical protein
MAEHNYTWARVVQMCHQVYPDDAELAELSATEAFDEDANALQAEQLDGEAATEAEVAEVEAAWRTF